MPTNEERREIAERLRAMCAYGCKYAEQFYDLLFETVMDEWDDYTFGEVADRIADLIEPEPEPERTCEDVSTEHGKFECSYCGCKITDTTCVDNGLVHFCPDCGRSIENAY